MCFLLLQRLYKAYGDAIGRPGQCRQVEVFKGNKIWKFQVKVWKFMLSPAHSSKCIMSFNSQIIQPKTKRKSLLREETNKLDPVHRHCILWKIVHCQGKNGSMEKWKLKVAYKSFNLPFNFCKFSNWCFYDFYVSFIFEEGDHLRMIIDDTYFVLQSQRLKVSLNKDTVTPSS